jgi:Flp pilus assembly protein TadD
MSGTVTPEPAAPTKTWEQHHEAGRRRFAEGDAAGAEEAFRAAIAQAEQPGGDPLQVASSLSSLGQLKYQQKDYGGAEECFRRSLELREQALGGDHPTVISGINNLAALYVARGALDEAEPLLQRAMGVTVKRVEATQAELAVNLNNLVRLYVKRGDYARAEPLVVRLLALKRPLGPEHPDVAAVLVTLAKLRLSMGQSEAAERLWRRVLAVRQRTLAPNDLVLASTLDGLADACAAQGKHDQELTLRERSLVVRTAAGGPDHPSLEAHRARIAALRQATPSGRNAAPVKTASTTPNGGPTGLANGVTGLTGVIPNVIPEAMAVTRALNEQAAKSGGTGSEPGAGATGRPAMSDVRATVKADGAQPTSGRPTPGRAPATATSGSNGAAAAGGPRPTRPPGAPVPPADRSRPAPIPEVRRPTPIPEIETQSAADQAAPTAAANAPAATAAERGPRAAAPVSPTPAGGVKWVDPAQIAPPAPKPPISIETHARPKLKMAERGRSTSGSGRGKMVALAVLAIVLVGGAAAAWFTRNQWSGAASTGAKPAGRAAHSAPASPAAAVAAPSAVGATALPPDQTTASAPGGNAVDAAAAPTSAPASAEPVAERPPHPLPVPQPADQPVKATATPVRLPTAQPHQPPKPPVVHHRAPPEATDSTPSIPTIDVDAATRAIDDSVKARAPSATP